MNNRAGLSIILGLTLAAPIWAPSALGAETPEQLRLERIERRVARLSDMLLRLDALQRENRELRGELESVRHAMEQLKRRQRDLYLDLDQRVSGLQRKSAPVAAAPVAPVPAAPAPSVPVEAQSGASPVAGPPVVSAPVQAAPAVAAAPPATPATSQSAPVAPAPSAISPESAKPPVAIPPPVAVEALPPLPAPNGASATPVAPAAPVADPKLEQQDYDQAMALLDQARYKAAIDQFRAYLGKYPKGTLRPNAQYWLAECHYVVQENDAALKAFESVVADYPDSAKASGALLKIGFIKQAKGDLPSAKASYDRLVREYPTSTSAGTARQRLQSLAQQR